ncbi:unnamed protein product, partial [Agarophyton chilense]
HRPSATPIAAAAASAASFDALRVPCAVADALRAASIHVPTTVQCAAIPRARLGCDVVAHAASGSGKTVAFVVIALEALLAMNALGAHRAAAPVALVLVPTRELAEQVSLVFRRVAALVRPLPRALVVRGGVPPAVDERLLARCAPHVVVGTPGRVLMLIESGVLVVQHISLLVLDEADRLADAAYTPPIPAICALLPSRRQTLAFSATFEPWLRDVLLSVMRTPAFFSFPIATHPSDHVDMLRRAILQNVTQFKLPVPGRLHAKLNRVAALLSHTRFKLCILFINDKRHVAKILMRLSALGYKAALMNATLHQRQRDRTIQHIQAAKLQLIVASDLLARGVDFEHCDLILHLDVPYDPATYLHRVGRAGRFGRNGSSLLIYNSTSDERHQVSALETSLGSPIPLYETSDQLNPRSAHQPNQLQQPHTPAKCTTNPESIRNSAHRLPLCSHSQLPDDCAAAEKHTHLSCCPRSVSERNALLPDSEAAQPSPNNDSCDPPPRKHRPYVESEKDARHPQTTPANRYTASLAKLPDAERCNSVTVARAADAEMNGSASPRGPRLKTLRGTTSLDGDDELERNRAAANERRCLAAKGADQEDRAAGLATSNPLVQVKMAEPCGEREQTGPDMRALVRPTLEAPTHKQASSFGVAQTSAEANLGERTEAIREFTQESLPSVEQNRASQLECQADSCATKAPAQTVQARTSSAEKCQAPALGNRYSLGGCGETCPEQADADHGASDMWDAYARDAYAAGYREAYEEAYRMARDVQQRLQETHI